MGELHTFELHALRLGKLLGNLQSIETGARLFLDKANEQRASQIICSLSKLKRGDWVEISPLTNGHDLRRILERYNKFANNNCRVDIDRIVDLRDALAHGRVFGHGPIQTANSLRLLKFKRDEKAKKVQVAMVEDMTEAWFNENIEFLMVSLEKIRTALDWNKADLKTPG